MRRNLLARLAFLAIALTMVFTMMGLVSSADVAKEDLRESLIQREQEFRENIQNRIENRKETNILLEETGTIRQHEIKRMEMELRASIEALMKENEVYSGYESFELELRNSQTIS